MTRLIMSCLILFSYLYINSKEIPVKQVEAKPLYYLDSLQPKVDVRPALLFSHNFFSKDEEGNFYFVDPENHRILKFRDGRFVSQIGSIGQGTEDLYHPLGIFIKDNIIYVLDNGGKKVKLFSLEGKLISNFYIDNAFGSDAIWVHENLIFVGVRYENKKFFNKENLISVFNREGKKIKSFGEIIESSNMWSYATFNSIYMNLMDNTIFGAFKYEPLIFAYNLDGRKIFSKDLSSLIKEFRDLRDYRDKIRFDTPMSVKNSGVKAINFCSAFGVDKNRNIYYAFNSSTLKVNRVFLFNKDGELVELIDFKYDKKNVNIINILISEENEFFGIGFTENPLKDVFLFKYLLERR